MKTLSRIVLALFFTAASIGIAAAAPYTWTDVIDWNPDRMVDARRDLHYTHTITDGANGFDGYVMGGDDIILNYSLRVSLYDDGGRRDGFEIAFVDQPGLLSDGLYNFNYSNQEFGWSIAGLLSLNLTGTLDVNIESWMGDFLADRSVFAAHGDNGSGSAPVPEPATILLFGSGLLGIAGATRKTIRKK